MKHAWLVVLALGFAWPIEIVAAPHSGEVLFGGLPVPGAVVTATRDSQTFSTVTDSQGRYRFADLADGRWSIRVEMLGFATTNQEIETTAAAPPSTWSLTLRPFEEIAAIASPPAQPESASPLAAVANAPGANASVPVASLPSPAFPPGRPVPGSDADLGQQAADGLLVNGSVNNGAASPFAQLAAFGNNRRGLRSLYNGGIAVILGNSAFDARSFSFNDTGATPKPSYRDAQFAGTFGGPIRVPGLVSRPNVFAMYQRTSDHTANTPPALMPTRLERLGDFSAARDAQGRPVVIRDPLTGQPFPGAVIPADRIAPQAASLLTYYPLPNIDETGRYNYQRPVLAVTGQDNVQARVTQPGFGRNQVFGNFAYQHTSANALSVFSFEDVTTISGIDGAINWARRFSPSTTLRLRYQFNRLVTETTSHFANRRNVSGDAMISGNNQEPENWGPPRLSFASGLESLVDGPFGRTSSQTHAWNAETFLGRGRHNITFGGDVRLQDVALLSQQDARGSFTFTAAATGSDFADFLLGIPSASSIAFGNPDKYFRLPSYDGYVTDDWRFGPGFTLNAGVRWEYEAPATERYGRLVNLDVAPGFSAVSPVVASNPVGDLTGRQYPSSLVNPDKLGFQPRVGVALRPVAGSSLVIRAGYGVYRNTSIYQSIATLLAQQPPLSTTLSVENSAENPLTLANGFIAPPGRPANTLAIDPEFRVGYAENWQASVQRDFPPSLTILTTYLGTRGSRLVQQFLPNTYPAGATNPCPSCPAGFVYVTSNGRSTRHAGQVQVRRRLRNGLTATVQYTLSKAMDDAAAGLTGAGLPSVPSGSGMTIAQDWLNLDAEWAPSAFDQRHVVTAQFEYTTGVGAAGGGMLTGLAGTLFKGWTLTSQLTAGSGLPLTPIVLAPVSGTGVTGTIRADVIGAPAAPAGYYADPAAYTVPPSGQWGSAGRHSVVGPAQFGLNAGVTRTFPVGDRISADWRIDATNVLNRVTFSRVNTTVGSPQFGLPNLANTMRKIQMSLRFRF